MNSKSQAWRNTSSAAKTLVVPRILKLARRGVESWNKNRWCQRRWRHGWEREEERSYWCWREDERKRERERDDEARNIETDERSVTILWLRFSQEYKKKEKTSWLAPLQKHGNFWVLLKENKQSRYLHNFKIFYLFYHHSLTKFYFIGASLNLVNLLYMWKLWCVTYLI